MARHRSYWTYNIGSSPLGPGPLRFVPAAHRRRRGAAGRHPPGARAGPNTGPQGRRRAPRSAVPSRCRGPDGPRPKLLRPYYADKIGADLFAEKEARLSVAIREPQREVDDARVEVARSDDIADQFDDDARLLATLDVDKTWKAATEVERRVLIDEFIEEILVLPDYLDVKVEGAPPLHVRHQEVGLNESGLDRVGGGKQTISPPPAWATGWAA